MNSFLEDIEFASKVNEEIKRAEQRGIDNSLELTKEMIKQQYGDIEQLQQENKQLKEQLEILLEDNNQLEEIRIKAIEYIKSWVLDEYSIAVIDKEDDDCCYHEPNAREKLLEILGDKENDN